MDTNTAGTGTDFHTGTGHLRKFGTGNGHLRKFGTTINTGTGYLRKFGTKSISVGLVRHHTGTGHFGKFGTVRIHVPPVPVQTFIPVQDTLVISVHQYRYRTLR